MANTKSLDLEASSSQYASIANASQTGLDLTGDVTVEAWAKFESLPSSNGVQMWLANCYNGSTPRNGYGLGIEYNSGNIQIVFRFGSAPDTFNEEISDNVTINTGTWYHICGILDTTNSLIRFYLDGVAVGTTANSNSIAATTNDFYVGTQPSGTSEFLDGLIDEVRVWNDVRTAQEIADNKDKELVGNETGLVGYWKFNDSALDETSNNNDLTLVNSPVYSSDVPFTGAGGATSAFFQLF